MHNHPTPYPDLNRVLRELVGRAQAAAGDFDRISESDAYAKANLRP